MGDLVTWLRAQLDEDERRAPDKHDDPDEGGYYACPATRSEPYGDLAYGEDACACGLAERRRRALAEVDAKRRIVDLVLALSDDAAKRDTGDGVGLSHTFLALLALPYAGRPGYLQEWRP